ncbi:hypothetical protein F4861DRAFT_267034 [Xylaria intraflava]|nr:hypothetical protein F4861DRAFT_267034 [Xylaria intraflava]
MPLLRLPPETLAQIFGELGSSFFHEDLGRLTICKRWFEFALPVCVKRVTLSQETLRSLVASGAAARSFPLERNLEVLDLKLKGYHDPGSSTFEPQQAAQESNALDASASNEASDGISVKTWVDVLDDDLAQLAVIVQKSRRLRTLRIRAWSAPSLDPFDSSENYLSLPTMRSFLSVENLSVLVLDLPDVFPNPSGEQGNGLHICPAIGALLRTLKTLHIRMRSICPDVLKPRDSDDSLQLRVVVINLSLMTNQPGITSAAHARRCGSQGLRGLLRLKADMQKQGQALATRMATPKVMKILTHSLPNFDHLSLDVLTGKTTAPGDTGWDEDGEVVIADPEPESEHTDDDSTSSITSTDD